MKKIFITALAALISVSAMSQVRCVSSNPDYELTYKRSFTAGNNVIIDFLVTYYGKGKEWFKVCDTRIYDDEGNIYKTYLTAAGYQHDIIPDVGNTGEYAMYVESGIPVKVRITVQNVDEYATMLKKMILTCRVGEGPTSSLPFNIYNIPIPRN